MDKLEYKKQNKKATCNFLGEFEIQYKDHEDFGEGAAYVTDKNGREHFLGNFMKSVPLKFKKFNAWHGTSCLSAYAIILSECGDSVKLFRIYW